MCHAGEAARSSTCAVNAAWPATMAVQRIDAAAARTGQPRAQRGLTGGRKPPRPDRDRRDRRGREKATGSRVGPRGRTSSERREKRLRLRGRLDAGIVLEELLV